MKVVWDQLIEAAITYADFNSEYNISDLNEKTNFFGLSFLLFFLDCRSRNILRLFSGNLPAMFDYCQISRQQEPLRQRSSALSQQHWRCYQPQLPVLCQGSPWDSGVRILSSFECMLLRRSMCRRSFGNFVGWLLYSAIACCRLPCVPLQDISSGR